MALISDNHPHCLQTLLTKIVINDNMRSREVCKWCLPACFGCFPTVLITAACTDCSWLVKLVQLSVVQVADWVVFNTITAEQLGAAYFGHSAHWCYCWGCPSFETEAAIVEVCSTCSATLVTLHAQQHSWQIEVRKHQDQRSCHFSWAVSSMWCQLWLFFEPQELCPRGSSNSSCCLVMLDAWSYDWFKSWVAYMLKVVQI